MPRVAVVIPCLNEESSISTVIEDFRRALPEARILVFDNGSSDHTVQRAHEHGAEVCLVAERGKGNVVRRALADVESDVYVLVDGDDTYDASIAPTMVGLVIQNKVDLVTAARQYAPDSKQTRTGHQFGNTSISRLVRLLFRSSEPDVLSGYRAMSRRFVKSFPTTANGFEIEVQLTAHASLLRVQTSTVTGLYRERINGRSKLKTIKDGRKIVFSILRIYRGYAPSRFFGSFSLIACAAGFAPFMLTTRGELSSLVVAGLLWIASIILLVVGIVLNGISRIQYQQLRLAFLSQSDEGV